MHQHSHQEYPPTEPGKYAVDVAAFFEIERPSNHDEGWEAKAGPLQQTGFGKWQLNGKLLLEKHFDAAPGQETELEVVGQAQVKYRDSQPFEFGAQRFTEKDETRFGPAIFGKFALGAHTGPEVQAHLSGGPYRQDR